MTSAQGRARGKVQEHLEVPKRPYDGHAGGVRAPAFRHPGSRNVVATQRRGASLADHFSVPNRLCFTKIRLVSKLQALTGLGFS